MLFGYFTLFVALVIETVGAYYSITGLAAIFSGAVIPILIMGASLEVGKVTAAVWLKLNWDRASLAYKLYLVPAVAFLMLLTSMGIFGFLSKAHSDQNMVSGDVQAKIAIYDEKIKTERDNIDANRKALKQLDDAVDQVMGRSTDERGAERSVQIRRGQQSERGRLLKEIEQSQKRIASLNEERAPIAAEVRKVEAEVGPIKYIAALVYGDNPDANLLEAAVRWVIILIVAVFDPLALVLILAAQQSIRWAREEKTPETTAPTPAVVELPPAPQAESAEPPQDPSPPGWMFDNLPYLKNGAKMFFTGLKPMVAAPEPPKPEIHAGNPEDFQQPWPEEKREELVKVMASTFPETSETDPEETPEVQEAMRRWKSENPNDTLKRQRTLLERGYIKELPWMKMLADNQPAHQPVSGFGTEFPKHPGRGDSFVRVDYLPSRVFKYNGTSWMEVDKTITDSYTYDTAYIDHLIERISTGEYDPELLSDSERQQVADRLNQQSS